MSKTATIRDIDDGRPGYEQPGHIARSGVQNLVHKVVRAAGGTLTEHQPARLRTSIAMTVPADPLQGIAAARRIAGEAHALADRYARHARGAGMSWRDLAPALVDVDEEPAAAAFEHIAGEAASPFGQPPTVGWDCQSCGHRITDSGPYNGHPDDCESGHAKDCTRHRREVDAYLRWIESNE